MGYSVTVQKGNLGFFVEAEDKESGRRFRHEANLTLAQADRLAYRVTLADAINLDHWVEGTPRYGSLAYQADGYEAIQIAREAA